MQIEWWHWVVVGFCLIGLELFCSIIYNHLVRHGRPGGWHAEGCLAQFPSGGPALLWSIASICFTLMWFKYLKPKTDQTHAGMSKEGIIGETGIIIKGTDDTYEKGVVKFRISILGADEWSCYAEQLLKIGDNVKVVDIEGQILKVSKQ
jgi:membrane protein implicated in regulation of membrane protease activity